MKQTARVPWDGLVSEKGWTMAEHDEIYRRLGEIEQRLAGDDVWQSQVSESLRRIMAAVDGNGRPGLKTRVDRLETSARLLRWGLAIVIGAGLTLLVRDGIGVLRQFWMAGGS